MILVTGATGDIGRRIVRLLCQQQKPVRSFVRLSSHSNELEHRGSDIFIGDLRREKDIQKACQGVKYIISTHGSGNDSLSLDYRANIELIDQAKIQGVEHFVFISVLGADRGYEDAPVFKAKRAVEKYLQNSGLNYTILRPSGLASNLLPLAERFRETGLYLLIGEATNRTSIVSSDDLAKIAVDSLIIDDARNQILPVGGPEILSRDQIPKIFGRIFNKEPIVINVPLFAVDSVRNLLGFFDSSTQKNLGTFRTLLADEFFCTSEETSNLERIYNFQLENLESFLRRYLAT
ncbi:MAG: SDR family oxidoreductase [Sphaerospermopsis sp. SIO1G2]|nr:SDR family oxidoreductase [Sphaerospermopsis sp. SIO1G1]NET69547.1 SDR family oxidoreductase [Sphaerospermopsis sp. SIO1G2]